MSSYNSKNRLITVQHYIGGLFFFVLFSGMLIMVFTDRSEHPIIILVQTIILVLLLSAAIFTNNKIKKFRT